MKSSVALNYLLPDNVIQSNPGIKANDQATSGENWGSLAKWAKT
ncbi:MAG: hypothetical protein Q8M11_06255 [Sulfuritalea sp.]|nr:hypothetical protein [Sulfuritalea sp.]MDP1982672.1 hypothetical protein [Sulfuritalea sp.]